MCFCDWFSGFVCLDLPDFHDGSVIHIRPNGEIEYETYKPMLVTGSFDDTVIVKSCLIPASPEWSVSNRMDETYRVYISGNPTKFLQGHNVYGHSDMLGVITDFVKIILEKIGVDEVTIARVMRNPIKITRLDLTQSYILDRPQDVTDWLRHAAIHMTGKNQKVNNDKTLYVGKNSRRASIKIYEKSAEMLVHKKNFNLTSEAFDILHTISKTLLRFEVTLRGKKLEEMDYHYINKVTNDMLNNQFGLQLEKINLPDNVDITESDLDHISYKYRGIYDAWLNGKDIRQTMSRAQFYRYRKYFLETFNLDLSMPPRELPKKTNVVPLWRYIVAGDRVYNPADDDEFLYVPRSFVTGKI